MVWVYYDEREAKERIKDKLCDVKIILSLFPLIYKAFRDILEKKSLNNLEDLNPILVNCIPEPGLLSRNCVSLYVLEFLKNLEESLEFLKQRNIDLNSQIYGRLIAKEAAQVISVITELLFIRFLVSRLNGLIHPYPKLTSGKVSDVKISYCGTDYYIEVGTLGTRLSEEKIRRIFYEVAKWFRDETRNKGLVGYWRFEVNTTLLHVDREKRILVEESVEKIKEEIERLKIDSLYGMNGTKLINATFIKSITSFNKSTIHPRVEIGLEETHPSRLSEISMEAMSRQVVRHIKEQLSQLEPGAPNIIAINTRHWSLALIAIDKQWSEEAYTFKKTLYPKLRPHLERLFKCEDTKDLVGIILYHNTPNEGIFIKNDNYLSRNNELEKVRKLIAQLGISNIETNEQAC